MRNTLYFTLLFIMSISVGAVPDSISIQGKLQQSNGQPLSGDRVYRIQFYDDSMAGNQIGTDLLGMVNVSEYGRFNIEVVPPLEATNQTQLFYRIAVDSSITPDGTIDSEDNFPERVAVNSVMFAKSAHQSDVATTATYAATAGHASTATTATAALVSLTATTSTVATKLTGDINAGPLMLSNDVSIERLGFDLAINVNGELYKIPRYLQWKQKTASASFGGRADHSSVVFNDKMWVIGGYDGTNRLNDVWSSTNGTSWTQVTAAAAFSGRSAHRSVVFDDKMWVIAGKPDGNVFFDDIWSSTDGETWTLETDTPGFGARAWFGCLVYKDKIWVFGGDEPTSNEFNDVWNSTDGVSWTQVSASSLWSGRSNFVYYINDAEDRIWLIGGNDGMTDLDTAYSTADGLTWTSETAFASHVISSATAIFFGDRYYIHGDGNTGNVPSPYRYYSTNGEDWVQVTNNDFPPRYAYSTVVYHNRMYVIGGIGDFSMFSGDVWSLE